MLCYDRAIPEWIFYRYVALTMVHRSFNGEPTNRVIIKYLHTRQ